MADRTPVVALIGAGSMGRGIAYVLARAQIPVLVFDAHAENARAALDHLQRAMEGRISQGRMTREQARTALHGVHVVEHLDDLSPADVVIEAVVENLEIKRAILHKVEEKVRAGTLITTNTATLSINALSEGLRHPERFAGLRFLNPAPALRIVELIRGLRTAEATLAELRRFTQRFQYHAVTSQDTPGFIIAHLSRGLMGESARLLEAEVADVATLDAILASALSLRLAPFEMADAVGLDTLVDTARRLYEAWGGEPRFRVTPFLASRAAAGLVGRRTGQGFYDHRPQAVPIHPASEAGVPWDGPVYLSQRHPDLAAATSRRWPSVERAEAPGPGVLAIVTPVGTDVITETVRQGLDPRTTVGVDAVSPGARVTLAGTAVTTPAARRGAIALYDWNGTPVSVVRDTPGLVAQRTAAMVVAVAYAMLDRSIASSEDIDLAARKALGYGQGPFALAQTIGLSRVVEILHALFEATGDARWRVPTNLRQSALLEQAVSGT